jgi:hypothetical protein
VRGDRRVGLEHLVVDGRGVHGLGQVAQVQLQDAGNGVDVALLQQLGVDLIKSVAPVIYG